jgi:glycosyltransferase involved in cell wall biosynthesis
MQISAVIPSHNRRHTLERALRSVFEQSSAVEEVILVDDGSTDGSAEMVACEFAEVKIIQQPNLGVSAARNRGIETARHDWIALLDSDDSWLAHKIEKIRLAQRQQPGFVLYHSDEIWMRRGVRVNPMRKHRKQGGWIFEQCLPLCAISPSAAVIRKSVLQELGMFDPGLPACEDYDLWLRLCHRFPVHYLEEALIVKYGGHDDQLSRRHPAMDQFRARSLHRLLREANLADSQQEAAREVLMAKLDILLKGANRHGNQALIDEFAPLREYWRGPAQRKASC